MSGRILLVDALNLIRRIFEARPDSGENIGDVIEACARSLRRALKDHSPSHGAVVFDSTMTTWRHEFYADYKMGRKPTPAALIENMPEFVRRFEELGISTLLVDSFEADDVIATLADGVANSTAGDGLEVVILSTDKSFLQLLKPGLRVYHHFDQRELDEQSVLDKYNVNIDQLTAYWALAGDASNNIKGVPKIGAKTAANLIAQYGSLEAILGDEAANSSALRVQQHGDLVQQCKQLVTLKTDVRVGINLKLLRLKEPSK